MPLALYPTFIMLVTLVRELRFGMLMTPLACSAMSDLKVRFQRLLAEGPKYGYFPEVSWGFCWP